MATRKGATKTVGGKRFRYNGTKWVQIKATGNVTPTSSSNRSARSNKSTAQVTDNNNRPRRGGTRTTTDTQRTSTGSARVTTKPLTLPPGTKGGALSAPAPTGSGGRRRGNTVTNPPSSGTRTATGRGGLPPQLRGVLETRGLLPPAGPRGTSQPTDGRTKPTRRSAAQAKADAAAAGSKNTNVRTGFRAGANTKPTRRMGPLSGLVERGLVAGLTPAAKWAGDRIADGAVSVLGTDEQKQKRFNKGVKAKGTGLRDVNGNPLPPARGAFNAVIADKVPTGSTTPPKTPEPKDTPKTDPRASTAPPRRGSGGSGGGRSAPAPIPKKTGANDPRNAAYIAARSKLNSKSTKAERDKVRDMGMDIHNKTFGKKASPTKTKPTKTKPTKQSAAQNLRTGRSPDPIPKKKKKKKEVLPYFGGNGIGRY